MTTYAQKSSAQRAAKKAHGASYLDIVSITENDEGQWEISPKGQALQAFIQASKAPAGLVAALEAPAPSPSLTPSPEGWGEIESGTDDQNMITLPSAEECAAQLAQAEAELIEAQAKADEEANQQAVAESNQERIDAGVWIKNSSIKLPTKKVWDIADRLYAEAEAIAKEEGTEVQYPSRKRVQEECVMQGIASGTARTQFQHWFKCRNDSKSAVIAVIGLDGKVSIPKK